MATPAESALIESIKRLNRDIYGLAHKVGMSWYPNPDAVTAGAEQAAKEAGLSGAWDWYKDYFKEGVSFFKSPIRNAKTIYQYQAAPDAATVASWVSKKTGLDIAVAQTEKELSDTFQVRRYAKQVLESALMFPEGSPDRERRVSIFAAMDGVANSGDVRMLQEESQRLWNEFTQTQDKFLIKKREFIDRLIPEAQKQAVSNGRPTGKATSPASFWAMPLEAQKRLAETFKPTVQGMGIITAIIAALPAWFVTASCVLVLLAILAAVVAVIAFFYYIVKGMSGIGGIGLLVGAVALGYLFMTSKKEKSSGNI